MRHHAWLLLCAACLSTPAPRQDADPSDGGVPSPDAHPRCELPGATVTFPPSGTILVWPGAAVDLDCDGRDELVLLVRADGVDEPKQGIYIIIAATGEAVFVPTGADDPHALLVEDLGGDAHPDLLVLGGRDTDDDPRVNEVARLLAFEGQGGLGFTAVGATDLPGFAPETGDGAFSTQWLVTLSLDGDAARDLMFSLPRSLHMAELAPWGTAGILDGAPTEIAGTWSGGQMAAFPSPGQPGFDDLVINDLFGIHYFRNPGNGTRWAGSEDYQPVVIEGGLQNTRVFTEVDGDGIPDAVGANEVSMGALGVVARVTHTGRAVYFFADSLDDEVENVTDTLAGEFDPGVAADLAVLDQRAGDARLVVRANLSLAGSDVVSAPARTFTFTGVRPDFLLDGDFVPGGGREIYGVASSGARQCVQVTATAIVACP